MAIQSLAIFDIDGTLIKGQSQMALLKFLYKKRYVTKWYYFKVMLWFGLYKLHLINDPKKIMEYAFSFFKDMPEEKAREIISEFFEFCLKHRFYGEGVSLIKRLKDENFHVILISNAVNILVEKIAQHLAVDSSKGTVLEIKNGILTGKIDGAIVYGVEKSNILKKYTSDNRFELINAYAYGDHISDIFMLELVGHPFAVNPSKKLNDIAVKNGWPILIFK